MDITDLRLFLSIKETSSLTHGAERVNLSLPAASTRIKHLEERFGARLLQRTNHGVILTPAGEVFLGHSQAVLQQLDLLEAAMGDVAQGVSGRIRICSHRTAMREFLPYILRNYLPLHPNVDVEIVAGRGEETIAAVTNGQADIGIYAKELRTPGLVSIPYRTDRFVLAVAPDHPLAARDSVSFEETIDYEYVGLQESLSIYGILKDTAATLRKTLKARVHVSDFETVISLISANLGIGILPDALAQRYQPHVKILQLRDEWAVRSWSLCVRNLETLPSFTRDLVDMLVADGKMLIYEKGSRVEKEQSVSA